jgi:hypothetical protein
MHLLQNFHPNKQPTQIYKIIEIQGISRVIMSTTDLKMQPTIHSKVNVDI